MRPCEVLFVYGRQYSVQASGTDRISGPGFALREERRVIIIRAPRGLNPLKKYASRIRIRARAEGGTEDPSVENN